MKEQQYIDPIQAQRIRVAVDAVVIANEANESYILLIKRQYEPFKNCWALPGGFLHTDEELIDGIARELFEETNIETNHLKETFREVGVFSKQGRDPRPQRVISIAYRIDLNERKETKVANEVIEIKWISIAELNQIELAFDHREIVERALVK